MKYTNAFYSGLNRLKETLEKKNAVLIGAGAGLSAAAGFTYDGERFLKYFSDFKKKYGITDIYTGGFYPFKTPNEFWAWWSRQIWINRYMKPKYPVYEDLLGLVKDKDYFVITTNVDHCFQKAGFEKSRLFYTQGDFGLFQCSVPCRNVTYDNKEAVIEMLKAQGYGVITEDELISSDAPKMNVPDELIPLCPNCGKPLTTNLRIDSTFVEDELWHSAADRYNEYIDAHKDSNILYFELGVGGNTPGVIKYPFWQMTYANKRSVFACINKGQAVCPKEIKDRAILIYGDIREALNLLKE